MPLTEFENRVRFLVELARRLHQYGTSAPRLEDALGIVADRLGFACNILATPTSVIISFNVLTDGADALPRSTQVIRLAPGEVNLRRLAEVDQIAEQVSAGQLDLAAGLAALRAVPSRLGLRASLLQVLSFGIAAGTVTALLKGGGADVLVAAALGLLIGLFSQLVARHRNLAPSFEAVAAFIAMFAAVMIAAFWQPLRIDLVVIAALIVLLPGLALTTAVVELSTQHLVAGTVRFMGATAVLLKLVFGTVAAVQVAKLLATPPPMVNTAVLPDWTEWLALIAASYAFAVLFQAARRDFAVAMLASWLGYLTTRIGSHWAGPEFAVFLSGLVVGSAANLYARLLHRPGAIVRLPGIIMLVPGTVGFRSLFYVFERDVFLGLDKAFSLIVILASLVAGLLFGNLLVPPRRSI
ncbi:MAG: threonine/serine exporter ThrE family protein [Lysobacterales bacterium]